MEVFTATLQLTCILLMMIAWSFVLILKPEWIWRLERWLGSKGGAPSGRYLALVRMGGILLLCLCVGMGIWYMGRII